MADDEEIKGIDVSGRGYFGLPVPRGAVELPANLRKDGWRSWLIIAGQAMRGNFTPMSRLMDLYDPQGDYRLNFQCVILLGDAGPSRCFEPLTRELEAPSDPDDYEVALNFSYALAIRGRLGDVPLLLRTYERLASIKDADIMDVYLSSLLERVKGEFPCPYPSDLASMHEYSNMIMTRYAEMVDRLGVDAFVLGGEPFGVVRLARRILADLREPYFWPDLRRRFEASTGIDCSSFYRNQTLQVLAAAAIVEEFLNGSAASRYQDGVRYFFGRPIPG